MLPLQNFIPNWVLVDHLKKSTQFTLEKIDYPRIDINSSCYSVYLNHACIDFLSNEQKSTNSKFIILNADGRICKYFVNLSIDEEDVKGSLVVNLDQFVQLNNKWLKNIVSYGIAGIAGFTLVWNVGRMIHKSINDFILFKDTMKKLVTNVERIKTGVCDIDENTKKIYWRVDKIESWVSKQSSSSRY